MREKLNISKEIKNEIIDHYNSGISMRKIELLYTKLGFKLTKTLKPDYWYYNCKYGRDKRFHKFGFGKSNLKKKFPKIYDDNKTEWEMIQELGFDRIWDCGKFKYEIDF